MRTIWDDRLDGMTVLKEGWDSYDGIPPSRLVVDFARAFVREAVESNIWPSAVVAESTGGVSVTFRDGDDHEAVIVNFANVGHNTIWHNDDVGAKQFEVTREGFAEARRLVKAHARQSFVTANPEEVKCPNCKGRRIEMWMRASVYLNDPMWCGDCGRSFVAVECRDLNWRPSVA
jgi:hypothetical protein